MSHDVIVVGGGGAGMCAALAARESGAKVLVLERAPRDKRGGNTAFASGTWLGWMQDLPMKPSRRAASASRVYPSGSFTVP